MGSSGKLRVHSVTYIAFYYGGDRTYLALPVLDALRAAEEETWPLLSGIDRTSNVVSRVNFIL